MGDNDFTAGDPWGLPIEDSEEVEIKAAPDETDAGSIRSDVEQAAGDETEPESSPAERELSDDAGEPADKPAEDGEPTFEEDSAWEPGAAAFTPMTGDDQDASPDDGDNAEVDGDAWAPIEEQVSTFAGADDGDGAEGAESSDSIEDEYEFRPPARTPLSQMIAAAQSVVSSVQGDQPGDPDESPEPEPSPDERSETGDDDGVESEPSDLTGGTDESPPPMAVSDPSDDEDLPNELPAWMIVEPEAESAMPDLVADGTEIGLTTDDEAEFTPMDIEASIADLATPEVPEVPFAEDQFEMPGAVEPERQDDFGVVDMDSSPGVYSELHDLDDQDAQAEELLREAAQAFSGSVEPAEEPTDVPDLEPAQDEDLDRYADALATNLETTEPAEEPTDVPDLEPAQDEDLDRYADALATNLETTEPAEEPTDVPDLEPAQDEDLDRYADALATNLETTEPAEEPTDVPDLEPAQDEDLDRYADALATNFETVEPAVESWEAAPADLIDVDADDHLSDDELGAALAGITDASDDDSSSILEDAGPVAVGWWDADDGDVEETPSVGSTEELDVEETPSVSSTEEPEETPVEGVSEEAGTADWWQADPEVEVTASDDGEDAAAVTEEEIGGFAGFGTDTTAEAVDADDELTFVEDTQPVEPEPASLIDSPVAWGTQYRQAHQGWVEDDAGRSTWRPIVTSGQSVAGWDIDIYLGLVSGDVAIDPVPKEDIASEVATAREGAVRHMLDEGLARGAHAIVGVTFTIEEVGGIVLVGSSGVAVTLRTPA